MKLREAFVSKMAVAALVASVAPAAPASAQKNPDSQNAAPAPVKAEVKTFRSVAPDPLVPVGVIAGLGGAYALVFLVAGTRRMRGRNLHAAAAAITVVTLLNPEFVSEERAMLPTEVALIVDKTASQTLNDRAKVTEAAKVDIAKKLSAFPGINLRVVEIDGKGRQDGTLLFGAIGEALSDINPDRLGAVIALTDGQVHDAADADSVLPGGVPLHALISGQEREFDRRIILEAAPSFGLVHQSQEIKFRIADDVSKPSGGRVRVQVSSEGRNLATVMATPGETVSIKVDIRHAGTNQIELKAEPLKGELTESNNRLVVPVEGIRQNLSVLLVSGGPDPNIRLWRDLLKADAGTDLVHFTIRRTPEKVDNTPIRELSLIPLPTDELFTTKLGKFDLIIFDHYEYNGLIPTPYFNNVARHVKDGGAVMVVSGREYAESRSLYNTPLASILPAAPALGKVSDTPYIPRVSGTGNRHPVTRSLAAESNPQNWGRWISQVETLGQPSGHVVMEGDAGKPLLVLKREGKGRVAMLQSDNAWLWARGFDGGGPYASLLSQTMQWLLKNPGLEEESLSMRVEDSKLVIEQQTMGKESKPVAVETPSGKSMPVPLAAAGPGIWRATVPAGEQGVYSVSYQGADAPYAWLNIGPSSPAEYANPVSTTEILKPIVEKTGGKISRMTDDLPDIVERKRNESMSGPGWMGIRRTETSIQTGQTQVPLLPWWLGLTMGLTLMGAAWWRESETPLFKKKNAAIDNGPKP